MKIVEAVLVVLFVAWIPLLAIFSLLLIAGLSPDKEHGSMKYGFVGLIKPEDLRPWGRKVRTIHRILSWGFPVLLIAILATLAFK